GLHVLDDDAAAAHLERGRDPLGPPDVVAEVDADDAAGGHGEALEPDGLPGPGLGREGRVDDGGAREGVEQHDEVDRVAGGGAPGQVPPGRRRRAAGRGVGAVAAGHPVLDHHGAAVDLDHRRGERGVDHVAQPQRRLAVRRHRELLDDRLAGRGGRGARGAGDVPADDCHDRGAPLVRGVGDDHGVVRGERPPGRPVAVLAVLAGRTVLLVVPRRLLAAVRTAVRATLVEAVLVRLVPGARRGGRRRRQLGPVVAGRPGGAVPRRAAVAGRGHGHQAVDRARPGGRLASGLAARPAPVGRHPGEEQAAEREQRRHPPDEGVAVEADPGSAAPPAPDVGGLAGHGSTPDPTGSGSPRRSGSTGAPSAGSAGSSGAGGVGAGTPAAALPRPSGVAPPRRRPGPAAGGAGMPKRMRSATPTATAHTATCTPPTARAAPVVRCTRWASPPRSTVNRSAQPSATPHAARSPSTVSSHRSDAVEACTTVAPAGSRPDASRPSPRTSTGRRSGSAPAAPTSRSPAAPVSARCRSGAATVLRNTTTPRSTPTCSRSSCSDSAVTSSSAARSAAGSAGRSSVGARWRGTATYWTPSGASTRPRRLVARRRARSRASPSRSLAP